jgi:hypothetical protein
VVVVVGSSPTEEAQQGCDAAANWAARYGFRAAEGTSGDAPDELGLKLPEIVWVNQNQNLIHNGTS